MVADSHYFNKEQDRDKNPHQNDKSDQYPPVFRIRIHFFRIRIQRIRMEANTDPDTDPDPIRIQGFNDTKPWYPHQVEKSDPDSDRH